MAYTVGTIVEMKNHTNQFKVSSYDWFFNELENNHISKIDGAKRNASILEEYDEEAKAYIIHQLFYINADAANELKKELKINEPFVSNENNKYIIKY